MKEKEGMKFFVGREGESKNEIFVVIMVNKKLKILAV